MDQNEDYIKKNSSKKHVRNSMSNFQIEGLMEKDKESKFRRNSAAQSKGDSKRKKKVSHQVGFNYVETFFDDIHTIIQIFFERFTFKQKVEAFQINNKDKQGLEYLIEILSNFPEFNIFDYLSDSLIPPTSKLEIERRKYFYIKRNNIFYTILLYCKKNNERSPFIDRHVDYFIRANLENLTQIDLEVDYFLLGLFDYKDKAKNLIIKQNEHFKTLLKDLNIKEVDLLGFFTRLDVSRDIYDLPIDEIVILRKILLNIITRRFPTGLIYLLSYESIPILMVEGRIWKAIISELPKEEVLEIWIQFYANLSGFLKKYDYYENNPDPDYLKKRIYIHTLENEYNIKIQNLKDEEDLLKQKEQKTHELVEYENIAKQRDLVTREREELERDINLTPIVEFVDLLRIIFQYNKKEVALVILDSPLTEINPTLEIFVFCLNHVEHLAM
jgi:hypothetical protein